MVLEGTSLFLNEMKWVKDPITVKNITRVLNVLLNFDWVNMNSVILQTRIKIRNVMAKNTISTPIQSDLFPVILQYGMKNAKNKMTQKG